MSSESGGDLYGFRRSLRCFFYAVSYASDGLFDAAAVVRVARRRAQHQWLWAVATGIEVT